MGISRTLTSGPGPSRIVPGVDHRARLIRKLFLASQDQDLRQRFATYERVAASTGVRERVEGLLRCSHRARAAIPTPQPRTAVQQLDALIVRRGARLGRYRISRHLARGGMGDVWLAVEHPSMAQVAIKTLRPAAWLPSDGSTLLRFAREARALGSFVHPALCRLRDSGEIDGVPFLAMDYVAGATLHERIRSGWSDARASARLVATLAEALQVVHSAGFVHRDVKPGNIVIQPCGAPVLLDFGLAREIGVPPIDSAPRRMGTPPYMAPEQIRRTAVDPRTDVYALGVVLYECLTGRPPYRGTDARAVYRDILRAAPRPPRGIDPTIPRELEQVCLRAMAALPGARYSTAAEVAAALRAVDSATEFTTTAGQSVGA